MTKADIVKLFTYTPDLCNAGNIELLNVKSSMREQSVFSYIEGVKVRTFRGKCVGRNSEKNFVVAPFEWLKNFRFVWVLHDGQPDHWIRAAIS